jgi:hypothetical protein
MKKYLKYEPLIYLLTYLDAMVIHHIVAHTFYLYHLFISRDLHIGYLFSESQSFVGCPMDIINASSYWKYVV